MRRALVVLIVGLLVVWRLRRMHRDEPAPAPPPPPPKPLPVAVDAAPPAPPVDAAELAAVAPLPIQGQSTIAALIAVAGRLVWTDGAGSIWTMSTRGADAHELSNQHDPGGPMFQALAAIGDTVYAGREGAIATVGLPAGPVTTLDWSLGSDDAYELRSDGHQLYGAMFAGHEIAHLGSAYAHISPMNEGTLAAYGSDVYAADFFAGMIMKVSSMPPRIVAGHIPHPSGFTIGDHAAYAWSQNTNVLYKIDLETHKVSVVSKTWITAGDQLAVDGDWLYAGRIAGDALELVRVKTDGSELQVLAEHLTGIGPMAADADAVYVPSQGDSAILRIDRARVQPIRVERPATVPP